MQCKSNLRQLYLGLQQYKDLYGCYVPYRIEIHRMSTRTALSGRAGNG